MRRISSSRLVVGWLFSGPAAPVNGGDLVDWIAMEASRER
jgi:hypothetical protein